MSDTEKSRDSFYWKPTHRVLCMGQWLYVHLLDGAAYGYIECRDSENASVEFDGRQWTFLGDARISRAVAISTEEAEAVATLAYAIA